MSCLESHKDFPFIQECYTSEGELKPDLSESQKEKLLVVLKERAYLEFVEKMNSVENGQDE
jgi:hypothetical protein